jgi:hypothetical protein
MRALCVLCGTVSINGAGGFGGMAIIQLIDRNRTVSHSGSGVRRRALPLVRASGDPANHETSWIAALASRGNERRVAALAFKTRNAGFAVCAMFSHRRDDGYRQS